MQNIIIKRCMGKSDDWKFIEGLTDENIEILNGIGYGSIKDKGTLNEYLNTLNNGYKYAITTVCYNGQEYTDELAVSYCKVSDGKVILNDKHLYNNNHEAQIMLQTLFQYVYGALSTKDMKNLNAKYIAYKEEKESNGLVPDSYYTWILQQVDINILIK